MFLPDDTDEKIFLVVTRYVSRLLRKNVPLSRKTLVRGKIEVSAIGDCLCVFFAFGKAVVRSCLVFL